MVLNQCLILGIVVNLAKSKLVKDKNQILRHEVGHTTG